MEWSSQWNKTHVIQTGLATNKEATTGKDSLNLYARCSHCAEYCKGNF